MSTLTAVVAVAGVVAWRFGFRRPDGVVRRWAPVLTVAAVAALISPVVTPFVAVVPVHRWLRTRRRHRVRAAALLDETLEATELLALVVAGGLNVRRALQDVAPWLSGELGAGIREALARSAGSSLLADELDHLCGRDVAPVRRLAVLLTGAERYGAPIVPGLAALADELRAARRRSLESAARRVPVRLLGPLLLGVLPAFVLLAVVPLLIGALTGLASG